VLREIDAVNEAIRIALEGVPSHGTSLRNPHPNLPPGRGKEHHGASLPPAETGKEHHGASPPPPGRWRVGVGVEDPITTPPSQPSPSLSRGKE
jgi:hypothetical protein